MKKCLLLLLALALYSSVSAQSVNPKYEMRGVWVASLGIDWPSRVGSTVSDIEAQKAQLKDLIAKYKSYGLNTVFFHVRPKCDAVYKSSFEPWSKYLTGVQGKAPADPNYDPLQFAIEEAHKQGLELHAWLNPYRAVAPYDNVSALAANHVVNTHPEWIIKCDGTQYRFLNPGLQEVRDYVTQVVMDIVRRYDVDGIHFDDYFYPYSSYGTFNDDATFAAYSNGFSDRTKWRENNVNLLLATLNDSIKAEKPFVKYGISPSGNQSVNLSIYSRTSDWLSGIYTDINGVSHTGVAYIDYIVPQLYWVNYYGRLPQWSEPSFVNGRHLYIGHAAYRLEEDGWPIDELSRQIKMNRETETVEGSIYFSSKSLVANLAHCTDTMKNNYYKHPALLPKMGWKEQVAPTVVSDFKYVQSGTPTTTTLEWSAPANAVNEGEFLKYVIYRFDKSNITAVDLENTANIEEIVTTTSYSPVYSVERGNYYVVTAVDANSNESGMSSVVNVVPIGVSSPVTPMNTTVGNPDSLLLKWTKAENGASYQVQIANDAGFASVVVNRSVVGDTSYSFGAALPLTDYYWRVKPCSANGEGEYSETVHFSTSESLPVELTLFAAQLGKESVCLNWQTETETNNYGFEIERSYAKNEGFEKVGFVTGNGNSNSVKYYAFTDKNPVAGKTVYRLKQIDYDGKYEYSKEIEVLYEGVKEFALEQNYPNPFNPTTIINYSIPEDAHVSIKVYNILGREISTLVNRDKKAGSYSVEFNGADLASGVYIYSIKSCEYSESKRMLLLK